MPEFQIVSEMRSLTRSGFYSKQALIDLYSDEICESCGLDPDDVMAIIEADLQALAEEKVTWPAVTDCDRLDAAFTELKSQGLITLHNVGITQMEGANGVQKHYQSHPNPDAVKGYCFYHTTDLERAIRGLGLYLAFGPMDTALEDVQGPIIGEQVRQSLEAQGLIVEWDGTFNTRMLLPDIVWQRR